MPVTHKVGHSDYTVEKVSIARGIFWIIDHVLKNKRDIFYADLTAGCGHIPNSVPAAPGCALAWLNVLRERGHDHPTLHLIELDAENCGGLFLAMEDHSNRLIYEPCWEVYHGDFADVLPSLVNALPDRRHNGAVFIDPNGIIPSLDVLQRLFKTNKLNGVDVILNVGATTYKRCSGAGHDTPTLEDTIASFSKRHWIVREPYGRNQWTFLIGSNWDGFPTWEKRGFHRIESEHGEALIWKLTHTNGELYGIQDLPGLS